MRRPAAGARARVHKVLSLLGVLAGFALLPASASALGTDQVDHLQPAGTVDLSALASAPTAASPNVRRFAVAYLRAHHWAAGSTSALAGDALGGAGGPASRVVMGGQTGAFTGIGTIDMQKGGTGKYAGTNPALEPPDQGVCSNGSYIIETVNVSLRVYSAKGRPLTAKSVPLAQFFDRQPNGSANTDFISDPRCIYDSQTKRWFVTILDLAEPATGQYIDDRNYIAVSETSNPTGKWRIYSFDVTDNGLHGTPTHPGCVGAPLGVFAGCLGDQPTIGTDRYGIYVTDNEYAFAEVFPVSPPVVPPFQQIPVLRSGVAQLYALSKSQLVHGSDTTLVRFDTDSIPFPGPSEDSPWQTVSPARPVPHDTSRIPASGVEYFLSDVGLPVGHDANQIVVWAWTNTASLNTSSPSLLLQHKIIPTARSADSFFAPDPSAPASQPFAAYQKNGPHPTAQASGDPEEYLNANDDRMSWVTLSGGSLWTAINTLLPASHPGASGHAGENRVGIMYFKVTPSLSHGKLSARTARDGYVEVPDANVLFGSIGPRADGATVMTFTLSGIKYFPSLAWTRLDGLKAGAAPAVHVALLGKAPEDGFSGLGNLGQLGLPDVPPCNPCVARWGDYSATEVVPNGCVVGAAEYIPTGKHDSLNSTDWGTGVYWVCPPPLRRTTTHHRSGHGGSRHRTGRTGSSPPDRSGDRTL